MILMKRSLAGRAETLFLTLSVAGLTGAALMAAAWLAAFVLRRVSID